MTEAMPFLQKTILLSYDPRPFARALFFSPYIPNSVYACCIVWRRGELPRLFFIMYLTALPGKQKNWSRIVDKRYPLRQVRSLTYILTYRFSALPNRWMSYPMQTL